MLVLYIERWFVLLVNFVVHYNPKNDLEFRLKEIQATLIFIYTAMPRVQRILYALTFVMHAFRAMWTASTIVTTNALENNKKWVFTLQKDTVSRLQHITHIPKGIWRSRNYTKPQIQDCKYSS